MRTRSIGLSLLAVLALVGAACNAAGTPAPSSSLKIGVVTDVGTVNDKNFNEYTFKGAVAGAAAIGAQAPTASVPKSADEYAALIKAWIDQGANIIVTAGFNLGVETTKAAHDNPNIWFIGVDQGPPCVDATGLPDTTFKCAGDAAKLLPKYVALSYQEDQAGYLAGMAAATLSKTGELGAIGGITLCGPCIRYIQGYQLGAQSINPNIKVDFAWVTTSDFVKAFNDPDTGKNFAKQFLAQYPKVDVLFQVAGKTGNGVLDAACDAKIYGIGVDVDQALSYPNAAKCTITSAEKKLAMSVEFDIKAIAAGTMKGGDDHWDAARDGVGYSPFHDLASLYPAGFAAKLDAALAAMKAGTLKTCPDKCGDLTTLQ
jgi:basic membrane protein A and related proteins